MNGIKTGVQKPEIISYNYIIVDKDCQIRAEKLKTGGFYLSQRMIDNINADYKNLYEKLKNRWNPEPTLTDQDKKLFN